MILLVGAEKGGVGKTSVAVNIAAIAAANDIDVLLLDTDTTGSASTWCRIRAEEKVNPSIPLFTLNTNPITALANAAPKHELIVVDVGARSYDTMLQVAILADLVLVPTTPGQFEAESTTNLFSAFRSVDVRHKTGRIPAHVVLNMLPTNAQSKEERDLREFLMESSIPVLKSIIRNRKAWRDASRSGRAIHELKGSDGSPKATAEMRNVYLEAESIASN